MRSTLSRYLLSVALGMAVVRSAAAAGTHSLARYQYTQYHMGVDVHLVVYASSEATAERASEAAFARFAELDAMMSDYRQDSELMRLCATAGGPPVRVSPDLFTVLQRAQQVARQSDGAFDITVGPLVALWRQARKTHRLPTDEQIRRAKELVGWQKVTLDPRERTVRLQAAGMRLDLGGIAKGYAGDCAQQVLTRHGIRQALVEAGGDIVVSGAPPGRKGWEIEVPNAARTAAAGSIPTIPFANCAVSTSGDTSQFVEIGGRRYSHIVDPRTGQGLTDRIAVTVVARDGLTSDSLSTAISVLGPGRGAGLARRYGVKQLWVRRAD